MKYLMLVFKTSVLFSLIALLCGCLFGLIGIKDVHEDKRSADEFGIVAVYLSESHMPKNLSSGKLGLGATTSPASNILAIKTLYQKTPSDLRIFYLKPGEYTNLDFDRFDVRLSHDYDLNNFTVKAGEVTYIGDYNFTFHLKEGGMLGTKWDGFDMNVVNNFNVRSAEIRNYLNQHLPNFSEAIIHNPAMIPSGYQY